MRWRNNKFSANRVQCAIFARCSTRCDRCWRVSFDHEARHELLAAAALQRIVPASSVLRLRLRLMERREEERRREERKGEESSRKREERRVASLRLAACISPNQRRGAHRYCPRPRASFHPRCFPSAQRAIMPIKPLIAPLLPAAVAGARARSPLPVPRLCCPIAARCTGTRSRLSTRMPLCRTRSPVLLKVAAPAPRHPANTSRSMPDEVAVFGAECSVLIAAIGVSVRVGGFVSIAPPPRRHSRARGRRSVRVANSARRLSTLPRSQSESRFILKVF